MTFTKPNKINVPGNACTFEIGAGARIALSPLNPPIDGHFVDGAKLETITTQGFGQIPQE